MLRDSSIPILVHTIQNNIWFEDILLVRLRRMLSAVEYPDIALRRLGRNKVRVLRHVACSVDFSLMADSLGYADWFRRTICRSVPQFFRGQARSIGAQGDWYTYLQTPRRSYLSLVSHRAYRRVWVVRETRFEHSRWPGQKYGCQEAVDDW